MMCAADVGVAPVRAFRVMLYLSEQHYYFVCLAPAAAAGL
jgi:hypothetical protein